MSRSLPWDDIRLPASDYNVRLISNGGAIPAFWGRDTDGHCLFLLNLEGDHRTLFSEGRTSVNGIGVDLRRDPSSDRQNLVLTLERQLDGDLFSSLCESLVASLRPVSRSDAALNVALTHIKRWKAFLAGRNARLMSSEEIRGLFAELTFLNGLYRDAMDQAGAISAWTGADRIHQDFVFADRAVEIKSLAGTDRSTVRISSEDQLETIQDALFLVTYRLRDAPDSGRACSLNDLVRQIETELNDAEAIEEFGRKLAVYGYVPLPEYDKPRLLVSGVQAYRVESGFPSIVRSGLPTGVTRVSYQIDIERMAPFGCPFERVLEGI
ncbi:PD-(D/E)XK motif protein [Rhizobium sp. AU243]|uniref:PD-(D/E)XK motif protein n=1 Tax=Rhizobium sp. AU243 TaxID=2303425 RepID=UPI0010CBB216|nr:PD-(D/E)XK motif protein [Rhizobium sp. AU243]TKV76135.1 PD-(D/E)XK motif protein [Rhizobium sp. AU243]